jgi:hypothetical protein
MQKRPDGVLSTTPSLTRIRLRTAPLLSTGLRWNPILDWISFRDSLSGREAYLTGHRVAAWEVGAAHRETKSVEKTAAHFGWPRVLVKRALAYARAFPEEINRARDEWWNSACEATFRDQGGLDGFAAGRRFQIDSESLGSGVGLTRLVADAKLSAPSP